MIILSIYGYDLIFGVDKFCFEGIFINLEIVVLLDNSVYTRFEIFISLFKESLFQIEIVIVLTKGFFSVVKLLNKGLSLLSKGLIASFQLLNVHVCICYHR